MTVALRKYAEITWGEALHIVLVAFRLPLVLAYKLLVSPFSATARHKPWRRVLADAALRHLLISNSIPQLQRLFGTDDKVYAGWTAKRRQPALIEAIGDDARLLWIGPKRMDCVILYLHGGGYWGPMQDFALDFWRAIQLQASRAGTPVGIAALSYALVPDAPFPTQLRQATRALQHLLDAGVPPAAITVTGDSAGGNLAAQLLAHLLHPLPGVPTPKLEAPLRGVYFMSPWVALEGVSGSHGLNGGADSFDGRTAGEWGAAVLRDVPPNARAYAEPSVAPKGWWAGLPSVVERVLVTTGELECLRDDDIEFAEVLREHHPEVWLEVQAGGVHNDPHCDFFAGQGSRPGDLTHLIAEWFVEGYKQ